MLDDTGNSGYDHDDVTKQRDHDRDAYCVVTSEVSIRNIGTKQWRNVAPADISELVTNSDRKEDLNGLPKLIESRETS